MLQKGDSQEIIAFTKSPIENPLLYQEVPFEYSEWDNIPSIITKTSLNLNRYMRSTIDFMGT